MNLRTYQADTLAAALERVKRELGRDAVILNTRTVRRGGLLGIGGRAMVEVTASAEINVLPRRPGGVRIPPQRKTGEPSVAEGAAMPAAISAEAVAGAPSDWRRELSELRSMVEGLVEETRASRSPCLPKQLHVIYRRLIAAQVASDLAARLLRRLQSEVSPAEWNDPEKLRSFLVDQIMRMLPTSGPLEICAAHRPHVVALIGPTGVGKTTTIAKLAAHYRLREHKKVGLVTIDTYRIAAVDQLKTYADILGVPLAVVLSPAELRETAAGMQGLDLVLIDTAGRSQKDDIRLSELKCFLQEIRPHEIHLVLSSTSSQANLAEAARRFGAAGASRVIFTKLDEAVGVGVMLDVLRMVKRSVSYVTTGQNVPHDIEVGRSDELARMIVGDL